MSLVVEPPLSDHGASVHSYSLSWASRLPRDAVYQVMVLPDLCFRCAAGQGFCDPTKFVYRCVCKPGYGGVHCSACAADHYLYPTCTYCHREGKCSGHGHCAFDGQCRCDFGFSGQNCSSCR